MNTHPAELRSAPVPLAVDVDGTLLKTDLLHEAALQFVAHHPWETPRLVGWALSGKAALKAKLADRVDPVIATMPLREETLAVIREAQAEGRPVYLASASDRRYIEQLAERVGGIAGVFATDGVTNLAGEAKARKLEEEFGPGGFDYAGDMPVDLAVWKSARRALVVAHSSGFEARVRKSFPDAEFIARPRVRPRPFIKALRVHQYAKNALIFLSMIAGHQLGVAAIIDSFLAFLCFCAAASSAYLINDLLDLPGDREHPRKRNRPIANGSLPIVSAVILGAALLPLSLAVAYLFLPLGFLAVLILYVVATLGYSLVLKRKVIVDVIMLAGLYTIRVLAGAAATDAAPSKWLLMFSLFLFLCLAIVKRCSELVQRRDAGKTKTVGRGYRVEDLAVLFPLAAAAATGAVFVVTLYTSSPEVMALYRHPIRMWLMCPILIYWTSRMLILSNRGQLHDDPVVFALTDRQSLLVGVLAAGVIAISV